MKFLVGERCVACRGDEPPATEDEIKKLMPQIPEWKLLEHEGIPRLERTYRFKNFREALAFTNRVGEIAEEEGHHPALLTEWGRVRVSMEREQWATQNGLSCLPLRKRPSI